MYFKRIGIYMNNVYYTVPIAGNFVDNKFRDLHGFSPALKNYLLEIVFVIQ